MRFKSKLVLPFLMLLMISGCGAEKENATEAAKTTEATTVAQESTTETTTELAVLNQTQGLKEEVITDEQALSSIKNYCHIQNPDLEKIEEEGDYSVYWEVVSSSDKEIVILYRSYTGADIRYYINPVSGETYVTEYVSGITTEEEKTDETFNIRNY